MNAGSQVLLTSNLPVQNKKSACQNHVLAVRVAPRQEPQFPFPTRRFPLTASNMEALGLLLEGSECMHLGVLPGIGTVLGVGGGGRGGAPKLFRSVKEVVAIRNLFYQSFIMRGKHNRKTSALCYNSTGMVFGCPSYRNPQTNHAFSVLLDPSASSAPVQCCSTCVNWYLE